MGDQSGERLGPFEIRSLVGAGGFATVYRAYDPRLNSEVAIKILAENHSLNLDTRERFINEAQALRRIKSPAMIGIHDIRETPDGRPYIVMELADRGPLVERRRQSVSNGWLPGAGDVLCVVDALTDALDAVHALELVHRDVTPSNLLIRRVHQQSKRRQVAVMEPGEQLVLADLGLVKDQAMGSALTIGGGTIGYASPEQQQALAQIDHRADIFSASVLVLWFLTGETALEMPDWRQDLHDRNWPASLVEVLDQGLSLDREDRHQSIVEWQDDLRAALGDTNNGSALQPRTAVPVGTARENVGRSWRKYAVGFAVGALVTAAAASAYALTTRRSADPVAAPIETSAETSASISGDAPPSTAVLELMVSSTTVPESTTTTSVAESTPSSTSPPESATTSSTPAEGQPVPQMFDLYFDRRQERIRIVIAWGLDPLPDGLATSEVQIAVDDGEWTTVINPPPEDEILDSRGWYLLGIGSGADAAWISPDQSYSGRVRWILEDGSATDWSETMVLSAES